MKSLLLLFLMLITAVPAFVNAENDTPGAKSAPEVLHSDSSVVPAPQQAPKEQKKIKKKHVKKNSPKGGMKKQISMTEEEQRIMHARNKADGYRLTQRKPQKQPR
ncbi:MAG TPA: hypothetical protein HPP97_01310 [Desulfuromonadales bacterium]|nr:hypothetical protein [Desulfuromonadales bacterium]